MNAPFMGCVGKLRRAAELLQEFIGQANEFSEKGEAFEVVNEFLSDGLEYAFVVKSVHAIPVDLSIRAGEVIQQLRSSLDYLITALVVQNGGTPTKKHTFPISDTQDKFIQAITRDIVGVGAAAIDLIRQCLPYHDADPRDNFLFALHELNIQDKHRLPLVLVASGEPPEKITMGLDERISTCCSDGNSPVIVNLSNPNERIMIASGVKVFSIFLDQPCPAFKADAHIDARVSFDKCGSATFIPAVDALTLMFVRTRELLAGFEEKFFAVK